MEKKSEKKSEKESCLKLPKLPRNHMGGGGERSCHGWIDNPTTSQSDKQSPSLQQQGATKKQILIKREPLDGGNRAFCSASKRQELHDLSVKFLL